MTWHFLARPQNCTLSPFCWAQASGQGDTDPHLLCKGLKWPIRSSPDSSGELEAKGAVGTRRREAVKREAPRAAVLRAPPRPPALSLALQR